MWNGILMQAGILMQFEWNGLRQPVELLLSSYPLCSLAVTRFFQELDRAVFSLLMTCLYFSNQRGGVGHHDNTEGCHPQLRINPVYICNLAACQTAGTLGKLSLALIMSGRK